MMLDIKRKPRESKEEKVLKDIGEHLYFITNMTANPPPWPDSLG